MTNEIIEPSKTPDIPKSQMIYQTAMTAEAHAWSAKTQDQRRQALADLQQIFKQNTKPGDTTFEVSTDGNRIVANSGTVDHPSQITTSKNDIQDLVLKQDAAGNFSATFTLTDHESHANAVFSLRTNAKGDITYGVEGTQTQVDGKYVSSDGTTTHNAGDTVISLRNDNGSLVFSEKPDGTHVADATFSDGTTKQKPITDDQFRFQQQNPALFVEWEDGHHYGEGAVSTPFATD